MSLIKEGTETYALHIMDNIFTQEEMKNHLLHTRKSSKSDRKLLLDQEKVKKPFGLSQ